MVKHLRNMDYFKYYSKNSIVIKNNLIFSFYVPASKLFLFRNRFFG